MKVRKTLPEELAGEKSSRREGKHIPGGCARENKKITKKSGKIKTEP